MSSDEVLFEVRDQIAWLTFNRPQARNALTWGMYDRFDQLIEQVNRDHSIRCLVLTGAGGGFVAGTDISQFRAFETERDALDYEEHGDHIFTALETARVPTIAAMAGSCTGAGFGIACTCDLRIGSPSLRMGIPIARTLGNCLSVANYTRFSTLIGPAKLKEIIFLARLMEADECLRIGLLTELVAGEEMLLPRAEEVARLVASHAPLTLRATKEALRRINRGMRPKESSDLILMCYMSRDFKEGVDAFLEKRPARWTGE